MKLKNDDFIAFTGDIGDFELLHNDYEYAELAQLYPNINSILVPKKAEYNLRKFASKSLLSEIDPNINIAVEKCLLVLSFLDSTFYKEHNEVKHNRWKHLHSEILLQQTKSYNKIIEVLKIGTATGAFIEMDEDFIHDEYTRKIRISDEYFKAGLTEYIIKDSGIIQTRNRIYYKQLNIAFENIICSNLLKLYPMIKLPSYDALLNIGKQHVKNGYTNKTGKLLTMRNKHKNNYWVDSHNRNFVEDNIELFEYLTGRGFMIPTVGDDRSVIDSFTLMPSWIRNEITINGLKLIDCEYMALYPNIAIKLYGGSIDYLTNEMVAEQIGKDIKEVKYEHLSFFNKNWNGMMESPLFDFYSKNEPDMLGRIYHDKNAHGHKITSKKMFEVEVNIMTDVIEYLNSKGIYTLYVYDALLCEEKDKELVAETMNRIILEHGVKTNVKLSNNKNDIQNIEKPEETLLESADINKNELKEIPEQIIIPIDKVILYGEIFKMYQEKINNGEQINFIEAIIEFPPVKEYTGNDRFPDRVLEIYNKSNPKVCFLSEYFLLNTN